MASEKRKATTDGRPSKKPKASPGDQASQRSSNVKAKDSNAADRRPVFNSVLLQEEKAFPRGGANILTPLEQKQIRAQAERDVLFEQQTGTAEPNTGDEDGLFEESAAPRSGKKRKREDKTKGDAAKEDAGPKIASLSYKSLIPGSLVLGRIVNITSKDLALALPNNLTGYVPITAISARLNERIQALLDEDDEDESEDVDLQKLFYIGQWLRAVVTEPEDSTKSSKRHIELSIDPMAVNAQLEPTNIVNNCILQVAVRSVEDHGVIVDLGLNKTNVKGFISKKELGHGYKVNDLQEGQVLLSIVTGKGSDGKVLKLSIDTSKFWSPQTAKSTAVLSELSDIEILLPGTLVDVLVTDSSLRGVSGKVAGLVDVTADALHSGISTSKDEDPAKKFRIASKTRGRIISSIPRDDGARQIAVSLLSHVLQLPPPVARLPPNSIDKMRAQAAALDGTIPAAHIIDKAVITRVAGDRGVHLELSTDDGKATNTAFSHISQLSDARIDDLSEHSGKYKLGTTHRARVLGFNPVDALYYVSLQESILSQAFLRIEDIKPGQIVDAKVDKLLLGGASGLSGVIIKLTSSITALVPTVHMSDIVLQHPEKKFREGFSVKARILSVDLDKRQVKATLKKTLVNDTTSKIWQDYSDLTVGDESKGTVSKLLEKGAIVQYYGSVRAFLPISEMSEAFIEDPSKHFKIGQTVATRIISVDASTEQLRVSCKTAVEMDPTTLKAWDAILPAQIISGSITAILADKIEVELDGGVAGVVRLGQLSDGAASKAEKLIKQFRVGQKLTELVVLSKNDRSQQVQLSYKTSFVKDAKDGNLIHNFSDVVAGRRFHGYVQNITPEGVYVEFAANVVALLPKSQLLPEALQQTSFGLRKDQTIKAWVFNIDSARERFALTMREPQEAAQEQKAPPPQVEPLSEAVDTGIKTTADLTLNRVTKARVVSIKNSQVNVRLADGIHGRIDVSEVFDKWSDIKDVKSPLEGHFKIGDTIDVKILGIRDSRGYRFLPFSHRGKGNAVVELSAKPSRVKNGDEKLLKGLDKVKVGDTHIAFINNTMDDCVWVNLSPSIRGRIALMDLSDDANQLQHVATSFPVGSALQVKVIKLAPDTGRLDLTARTESATNVTLDMLKVGETIPGRVTKSAENHVTLQFSDALAASVQLVELADDFDDADPSRFNKNDIVRARVLNIDLPNKRLVLSVRPSLVLSSSLPVKDPFIADHKRVQLESIVRGFVKHIGDKGVVVTLSGTVDAFVRIADLSDTFLKDWKSHLQLNQLVRGRVVEVDAAAKHVRLSLKASAVDENYKSPLKIEGIEVGSIVTGKVRKVEEFGVFIDIDNTQPRLSGLAHRSEVAEKRVNDVRGLYSPGDNVKAKVLKVEVDARRISLGLKAAYFKDDDESDQDVSMDDGVALDDEGDDEDGGIDLDAVPDMEDSGSSADEMDVDVEDEEPAKATTGLSTGGFDWSGNGLDTANGADYESEAELAPKKKRKSEIKVDKTGDLDKYGPQSTSDFERQLLGQPNDSALWIQYMAFHLELSEIQKARDIAERAIRTIHIRETDEKANIWIALLNLEVEYGDDESVEEVFKRACQVQDSLSMHEKLVSIYIDSGKHNKADAIFERIIGNKAFRASPEVWLNYATFLMSQLRQPDRAHALLSRAMQSVPKSEHRLLTAKFAALEFRTETGDAERGRTIFEGLVSEWPKWTTGWDMWVDIEQARISKAGGDKDGIERVRSLYERMSQAGMKKKRAKFVFKRWLEFEEAHGDEKGQDKVKAVAREFVEKLQSKGEDEE